MQQTLHKYNYYYINIIVIILTMNHIELPLLNPQ